MSNYFRNSRGQVFRSGTGGTYPVNNGDPQCDDDEAPGADELAQDEADARVNEDDWRRDR
jgi:hypothetical protein